jgi:hypothetical protein
MTETQAGELLAGNRQDPAGPAGQAQAAHRPAVLANQLKLAAQWGEPYLGYLLIHRPAAALTAALATLQDQVLAAEPDLRRQPGYALHATIGFLIPPLVQADRPDEIWRQHGAQWLTGITAAAAAEPGPLRLSFRRLIATDAAIVAVAGAPNPVTDLRSRLTAGLDLLWPLTKGPLVHVSLFRYRQPLRDPGRLLATLGAMDFALETEIDELLVVRETTFPLLEYEVVHRVQIGRPVR